MANAAGAVPLRWALLLVAACGRPESAEPVVKAPQDVAPARPQAGGIEEVEVEATGVGGTREDALRDAAIRAVEQVHGRAISMATVSIDLGSVSVQATRSTNNTTESAEARVSATLGGRRLVDATGGLLTALAVQRSIQEGGMWYVTVLASVARYIPPTSNKVRLVVAPAKDATGEAPASVREAIGRGISDVFVATGRIAVLERVADDLEAELAFATSGEARSTEALKRGQADIADIVVSTRVTTLRVERQVRKMRTAERELVSYVGRASLTYRAVHLATREVLASGTVETSKTSTESLTDGIDVDAWQTEMVQEITEAASQRLVSALLPIRVVARSAEEVTLNAGEGRLREGERYAVVVLGDLVMDPGTGESLGRRERPCCSVTVTQVTERASFGRLSEKPALGPGELLEVRVTMPPRAVTPP